MKKILLFPLFALMFSLPSLQKQSTEVKALAGDPMPTNINMTISSDAVLSAFYSGVNGKTGNDLVSYLHTKVDGHYEYNYTSATHRNIFKIIDRNWDLDAIDPQGPANTSNFNYSTDNGFIRKLYADYNDDITTADRYKNSGASSVSFDKEHIWAQSLGDFGRNYGAGSDLHALWPSDVKGNQNAHSNYNFGVPTTKIKELDNDKGTYVGRNGYVSGSTHKVFEPLDEFKGDVARAMFYMPARYFTYIDKDHPKLELVNYSSAGIIADGTTTGKAGILETLLEWNELDPVDEHEIRRNNLIAHNYQGNRNPFIDYPQWARIAYDPNYSGPSASNKLETSSVGTEGDPFNGLEVLSLSLDTAGVKTTYYKGETFDGRGLKVNAHYEEGHVRAVKNFTLDYEQNTILNTPGTYPVTISLSHNEKLVTASYDVVVREDSLSDYLLITQSYGGGGNSGAKYKRDFIEIYNKADHPISLLGKSIQYRATGPWDSFPITGEIAPNSFYLLNHRAGGGGTTDNPLGDNSGNTGMANNNYKVALVNSMQVLPADAEATNALIIDSLSVGSGNSPFPNYTSATTNTSGARRKMVGGEFVNTNNNKNDFEIVTPTPRNSALTIAIDIMKHSSVNSGACYDLFPLYKGRVADLTTNVIDEETLEVISEGQLSYFQNDLLESVMVDGRTRYEMWAQVIGELPYESETDTVIQNKVIQPLYFETVGILAIIGSILLGFYIIKGTRAKQA